MSRQANIRLGVIAAFVIALTATARADEWHTSGTLYAQFANMDGYTIVDGRRTDASVSTSSHADAIADQFVDMSSWSATRIAAYRKRVELEQKPEAILRIPSVKLVVPVFAGTSAAILDQAAGRIEGTSQFGASGNTGIAAHRDGFFRALRSVRVGDVLQVDLPEATLNYTVVSTFVVDPSETRVLRPTVEPTITLVTCYPFYFAGSAPQRFIVRATRAQRAEEIRLSRARD